MQNLKFLVGIGNRVTRSVVRHFFCLAQDTTDKSLFFLMTGFSIYFEKVLVRYLTQFYS